MPEKDEYKMKRNNSLYTWTIDAIDSGLDDDNIISVYGIDNKLYIKDTLNGLYKECRINDELADAPIIKWYAWGKNYIVIKIDDSTVDDDIEESFEDEDDWNPSEEEIASYERESEYADAHPETVWTSEQIKKHYGLS